MKKRFFYLIAFLLFIFSKSTIAQTAKMSDKQTNTENISIAKSTATETEEAPKAAKFATRKKAVVTDNAKIQKDSSKAITKPSASFTRKETYGNE